MKVIQIVPRNKIKERLKTLLNAKEREIRNRSTFIRKGTGRWGHKKHNGWINWKESLGGIIIAEVQSKIEESEWQLLIAYISYLDRHFSDKIESINISFR